MNKELIAGRCLRMLYIYFFLFWLWRAGMRVGCVYSNMFGDTASLSRRCLKGSMDRIRLCMSNLLWDQFTTALGLTPVKKALWEWNGWRKGKRVLQTDSQGNTGQFPNAELPRKLTHSYQMTSVQNAYPIWVIPQQIQVLVLQEEGQAVVLTRHTDMPFFSCQVWIW